MKEKLYNYLGEEISPTDIVVQDEKFGSVDNLGIVHINWAEESDIADANGFSKLERFEESNSFVIYNYVIPKGTMLCRYCLPTGRFTTLKGTAYEKLGLPYVKETIEYHEYMVSLDLMVDCFVTKGIVAPAFYSEGGAIQFMHRQSINLECQDGLLKEVKGWRQKGLRICT